jgi:hypothetical protein
MRYCKLLPILLPITLLVSMGPLRADAQVPPPSQDVPDADEIAVMASVLEAAYAHAAPGWVMVGARTATFDCNPSANIGVDVGGCSGMRVSTETVEERLGAVRQGIPEVSAKLVADLLRKSQHSVELSRPLPVRVKQVLWAPGAAADFNTSGNPTFAAYFSRVGFDAPRAKALIYLGTMNWTDRSKSIGQSLYLEKQKGSWVIKAHAKVWG